MCIIYKKMNSNLEALSDLQKILVSFFDELIDMFGQEGDFFALRIMIKDQIPITTIQKLFVNGLLPEKELIANRNKVFLDRNVLFSQMGEEKSNNFKRLFLGLDSDDQEMIWKWLDAFVILTEKSIK